MSDLKTVTFDSVKEGASHGVVFGHVVGVHIRDDLIVDGRVDVLKYIPVARLGYMDYTRVEKIFSMDRPDDLLTKAAE